MTHFEFRDLVSSTITMGVLVFTQKLFKFNFAYNKNLENNFPKPKILVKGIFWILSNFYHIYKKRKKIRSRTLIGNRILKNKGLITSSNS